MVVNFLGIQCEDQAADGGAQARPVPGQALGPAPGPVPGSSSAPPSLSRPLAQVLIDFLMYCHAVNFLLISYWFTIYI